MVSCEGRPIGWVHALSGDEAIRRVSVITGKCPTKCAARLVQVRPRSRRRLVHPRGDAVAAKSSRLGSITAVSWPS